MNALTRLVVVACLLGVVVTNGQSEDPKLKLDIAAAPQERLELPVLVLDEETDEPIANAKVTPWALRSSLGHGWWRDKDNDKGAQFGPESATTDEQGVATVIYPKFRVVQEQVKTTGVTVNVDHPKYGFKQSIHMDDLPLPVSPFEIRLKKGIPCEFRPTIDGKAIGLKNVYGFWSDGRSWQADVPREEGDTVFRLGAMTPGRNSVLLAKLDGELVTHFSKLTDFHLEIGEPYSEDLLLEPARVIKGVVGDDVPRPIKNGRIKVQTLPPRDISTGEERVMWFTWAPINPDGTFTIPGWPTDEKLQLIALCDGYIAKSGDAPREVAGGAAAASYLRPQVFEPDEPIVVEMTALADCDINLKDEDDKPVAGIKVASWPNVGWWNGGSQIYCHPLVRSEQMLVARDYHKATDKEHPQPFTATSNAKGVATLRLPVGTQNLAVMSDVYELPIFLGRRYSKVEAVAIKKTEKNLVLQPSGTEKLGDWDKLAGIVFGCSTREGRRIAALPEVRKKMDDFTDKFREGKNQSDPKLLAEAFTVVATAFEDVGDFDEAVKWHEKATEQFEKVQ